MEILSARGSKTRRFRDDWYLESVVEGEIEVAYETGRILEGIDSAGLEKLCNVPPGYFGVPDGFVRETSSLTVNGDGTRLEFKFVDVEQKPPTTEDDLRPIIVE